MAQSAHDNYISTDLDPGDTFTISLLVQGDVINSDDGNIHSARGNSYTCMIYAATSTAIRTTPTSASCFTQPAFSMLNTWTHVTMKVLDGSNIKFI